MKDVDFVFVLLAYINGEDLVDFFQSVKKNTLNASYVVVNAYHDDNSSEIIKKIADENKADYIEIPNKGYSYGNNTGITYAKSRYNFKYLVVSNPDIIIDCMSVDSLVGMENMVIGPKIINLRGKLQNPMFVSQNLFAQRMVYRGLKKNSKILFSFGIVLNKIKRGLFLAFKGAINAPVYQLHGSFVIFGNNVLARMDNVYDNNMFLFAEESYLAIELKKRGIESIYNPSIVVRHKEDGSMNFRNDINERLKEANIYVFEKYYGFR